MKLFMVPAAPNPTKVMLYIAEREALDVQFAIEQIMVNTLKGRHREAEHVQRNPFATLPVLELADGTYLLESLAIIQYLEDKYPHDALLVGDAETRGHARDLERTIETRITNPMSRYVHATNSPLGLPRDEKVIAEVEARLPTALKYVDDLLADGRPLLCGERVSVADCTLQAGLQFARFREVDLLAGYPHLQAWDKRYRQRPAALAVLKF